MSKDAESDTTLLDLDMQVCFALYSAQLAMNKVYRKLLKTLGLTYPQYLVMMVLKRLETAELVQRARSRADERQVEIRLTGQGKKLRKSAEAVPEAILCSTQCEPDQLLQLRNDLHSLRRRLASNDLAN